MGKFEVWNLREDQIKYENYVKKAIGATPYHMLEYLQAEEKAEGYPTKIFSYIEEGNFAILPSIVRKVNDLPFVQDMDIAVYDMVSPHEYSGILMNDVGMASKLLEEINRYCKKENIISAFIRLNPYLNDQVLFFERVGYEVLCSAKQVYVDLRQSIEEITKYYNKGVKSNLKKAEKIKLKFEIADKSELNKNIFVEIYNKSMEFLNANTFYYFNKDYFNLLFDNKNVILCFAKDEDGKVVAATVLLTNSKYAYYHLGCFDREYALLRGMDFIFYSMSIWCKNQGYDVLHLGGGHESLLFYKHKFSKDNVPYYIVKKIMSKDLYDQICEKWRRYYNCESESDYFPIYRLNEE